VPARDSGHIDGIGQTADMSDPKPDEARSWFPLALAGGFLAFALIVAFIGYATNRHGDPSKASTVNDVAELAIEAVDDTNSSLAERLSCTPGPDTKWTQLDSVQSVTKSGLKGGATGSFVLTIQSNQTRYSWTVTVGKAGNRSCIESMVSR
jgi:hypothetical protein